MSAFGHAIDIDSDDAENGSAPNWGVPDTKSEPKKSNLCFNCQEEGHRASDCPNPRKEKTMTCFNCQEEGHRSSDCPNPRKEKPMKCFNCQEDGHRSSDCPNPRKEKPMKCFNCQEDGHRSGDCPNPRVERAMKCFNCDGEGHVSKDCSEPRKITCFNCHETGHTFTDCPNLDDNERERRAANPSVPFIPDAFDLADQLSQMNTGIKFENYDKINTYFDGNKPRDMIENFVDADLNALLKANVRKIYQKPTPVQRACIPQIAAGRDVLISAQTGSGKTAAVLIPIISRLLDEPRTTSSRCTPQVLVVGPTRELVDQIFKHANALSNGSDLRCVKCYGGIGVNYNHEELKQGVDIVCCTTGRLKDFLDKGRIILSQLKFFVLDEVDRMLQKGFLDDFKEIISMVQCKPQMLMLSATVTDECRKIAKEYLTDFIFVKVGNVCAANDDVQQRVIKVDDNSKEDKLLEVLKDYKDKKVIIFTETKVRTDTLGVFFAESEEIWSSDRIVTIHSARTQQQREEALNRFRHWNSGGLFATSVVARGLDIPDVHLVVNYDLPDDADTYIHRIGRTARCGHSGVSITFFEPNKDAEQAGKLRDILRNVNQDVPDFLNEMAEISGTSYSGGDRSWGKKVTTRTNGFHHKGNDDDDDTAAGGWGTSNFEN